jgi:DNA-directed RNA polymerase
MEVAAAVRSADPREFLSSLPVHQDGSCNGLQHYAALGGDVDGGKEVNLIPGEKPGDVYSKVAVEVNKLVQQDAENGHDIAKALQGHIKRKVVKQTVRFSLSLSLALTRCRPLIFRLWVFVLHVGGDR